MDRTLTGTIAENGGAVTCRPIQCRIIAVLGYHYVLLFMLKPFSFVITKIRYMIISAPADNPPFHQSASNPNAHANIIGLLTRQIFMARS